MKVERREGEKRKEEGEGVKVGRRKGWKEIGRGGRSEERRRTEEDAKHSQNAGKPKKKQNPASELYTARSRVMQLLDEAQIKIFREP